MYKSAIAHYRNKYPEGQIKASEGSLDVYCSEGRHRISMQKNGAGQWVDVSEELGLEDRHDLAPIPQNSRAYKLYKDGRIGKSEEFDEREPVRRALAEHPCGGKGKVPSCEELKKSGHGKALVPGEPGDTSVDMEALKPPKKEASK